MSTGTQTPESWPSLPLDKWLQTQETLHLWTQVVGKVKLALTPFLNEWWNVAFTVAPRGLTTGAIPASHGSFSMDFDFVDHALHIRDSDGHSQSIPLAPKTVAAFHEEVMGALRAMGVTVAINPMPPRFPVRFRSIAIPVTRHTMRMP